MGHDIYARRIPARERDALYEKFSASAKGLEGDAWLQKYREYETAANVAYLRRSAGNPLNTIIYQALGAMDFYAGCSGAGDGRAFARAEIDAAMESLPGIPAERPHNFADDLVTLLRGEGVSVVGQSGGALTAHPSASELEPEYSFLRRILAWMDEHGRDSIEIEFC